MHPNIKDHDEEIIDTIMDLWEWEDQIEEDIQDENEYD
jgi:hypothetical protein